MLPFLSALQSWKWILFAGAVIAAVAGVCYTVHSYNSAIREAQEAKQKLKTVQGELDQERARTKRLQQDIVELQTYYTARENRQAHAAARQSQVLSRKEKKDEQGNIAADDPTLIDLNRLFPGDSDCNDTTNHPVPASLPPDDAGQIRSSG